MPRKLLAFLIAFVLLHCPPVFGLNANSIDTDAWYLIWNLDATGCLLPQNASVSGGFLNIQMTLNASLYQCPNQLTGAAVSSRYAAEYLSTRQLFQYGHVTSRIKFISAGAHAALWMLGYLCQPWPNASGCPPYPSAGASEVDICEVRINQTTTLREAVNTQANGFRVNDAGGLTDTTANFHVCDFDWTPTSMTWSVDNVQKFQLTTDIPSHPMYVIVGAYAGDQTPITDSVLPQTMQVNYVRVCAARSPVTSSCPSGTTNIFDDEFNGVGAIKTSAFVPHTVDQ